MVFLVKSWFKVEINTLSKPKIFCSYFLDAVKLLSGWKNASTELFQGRQR